MPRHRLVALAAAALVAACGGDPASRAPTAPTARPDFTVVQGATCTRADFDALSAKLQTVYAPAVRQDASRLLGRVRQGCPRKDAVLDLVQQTVAWRQANASNVVLDDATEWAFYTALFDYIGFGLDNEPDAVSDQGFIGVCTSGTGCEVIAERRTSGVKLFPGALGGTATERFLVTGAPTACRGTQDDPSIDEATDLQIFGQCIRVSVDPKQGSSFRLTRLAANPAAAIVQTCVSDESYALAKYLTTETLNLGDATTTRPRLAQRSEGESTVKLNRRPASPFFEADCDHADDVAAGPRRAPTGVERLLASPMLLAAGRAAEWLLLPRAAHAGHGGLGSLPGFVEEGFSKFGPADPFAFQATFDNPYPSLAVPSVVRTADVVGQQPVDDDLGRAEWTIGFQAPGYVRVQATPFGDFPTTNPPATVGGAPTPNRIVEINQGGGASNAKQGLDMLANLAFYDTDDSQTGLQANAGKYRIRWTSLVASPRAGGSGAPFVALGTRNGAAAELARFAYVNGSNAQSGSIAFNNVPVPGLSWTQNVRQRFEILVDLGAGVSYLRAVDLTSGASSTIKASFTFGPGGVLRQAGWRLGRQDNQVLGMDDFEIVRLPDAYVIQ